MANVIRKLAADELGVPADQAPSGLMRDYVERKMPIAEFKTLTLVSTFAAFGWQRARESNNADLEAWMSRLLLFCEQTAVEGGRTQLSWLLTGLPEPNYGVLVKRRTGIRPFAKICPSAWVSANVAFVKEMDFIQNRMAAGSSTYEQPAKEQPFKEPNDGDAAPAPKRPPRRKKPKVPPETS